MVSNYYYTGLKDLVYEQVYRVKRTRTSFFVIVIVSFFLFSKIHDVLHYLILNVN